MKSGIASIRKELAEIYSAEEIESLIFLIFEKLKGYSRTQFLLAKEEILTPEERFTIAQIILRLKNYEPIQYILGETEFFGLPFYTVPGVLIPRSETEELVQWIIQENQLENPTILDIGTGTGCIAISLRKNAPNSIVLACDISPVCIETARRNASRNNADVSFFEFDILKKIPEINISELDVIVSNPPYVRQSEKSMMDKNVLNFEPELALFVPNDDALRFYESIAEFALIYLKSAGRLYFEINEACGEECVEMLQKKGFSEIILKKDIHRKDRMIRSALHRTSISGQNPIQ
jgi:release factor glutamine methyltransferase